MEQIKKEFESLNINMKTDLELLTEALERYRKRDLDLDSRLTILTDLEFLLHQVGDNNLCSM